MSLISIEDMESLDFTYKDCVREYEIDLTDYSYVEDLDHFEQAPLTKDNLDEYIRKSAEWIFIKSVEEPFAAFEEGYKKVNTNNMLYESFTLDEIDKIVRGDPVIDWSLRQKMNNRSNAKKSISKSNLKIHIK